MAANSRLVWARNCSFFINCPRSSQWIDEKCDSPNIVFERPYLVSSVRILSTCSPCPVEGLRSVSDDNPSRWQFGFDANWSSWTCIAHIQPFKDGILCSCARLGCITDRFCADFRRFFIEPIVFLLTEPRNDRWRHSRRKNRWTYAARTRNLIWANSSTFLSSLEKDGWLKMKHAMAQRLTQLEESLLFPMDAEVDHSLWALGSIDPFCLSVASLITAWSMCPFADVKASRYHSCFSCQGNDDRGRK